MRGAEEDGSDSHAHVEYLTAIRKYSARKLPKTMKQPAVIKIGARTVMLNSAVES